MRLGTTFASLCTRLMASLAALNSCCPPSQFCGGAWKRWETSERSKASRRDERVTHVGGADVGARGGAGAGLGASKLTLQYVTTYSSFAPVGPEAVAPIPMPTRGSMCKHKTTRGAIFAVKRRRSSVGGRDDGSTIARAFEKSNTALFWEMVRFNPPILESCMPETDKPKGFFISAGSRGLLPTGTSLNPQHNFRSGGRSETTRTSDGASFDRGVRTARVPRERTHAASDPALAAPRIETEVAPRRCSIYLLARR